MKHLLNLAFPKALALEADVADGKKFLEHEHTYYVELEDLDQLKNAASMDMQEQWNVKLPKTETVGESSIRVRKIVEGDVNGGPNQKPEKEAQYVLTIKTEVGQQQRTEVPIPATQDAFELFKALCSGGMIKHRYHFPVEDGLVFEVDMYLNPEGGYYPFAKIDLEVNNNTGEIPEIPLKLKSCINGDSENAKDRETIRSYYSDYFLTKK